LITRQAVEAMKPGSVIVDLAAERGGNCELSEPDRLVEHAGVLILGPTDLPSQVPRHASQMFSKNVATLIDHLTQDGEIVLDLADEITDGVVVAAGGEVRHPAVRRKLELPALDPTDPTLEPQVDGSGS
jgi:NAD(P) transhydrogenase subunit alpha